MSKKKESFVTAAELMQELNSDPEWVRQNAIREAQHKARVEKVKAEVAEEEGPLLADLRELGYEVSSIWDLVNSNSNYAPAIPILAKYLPTTRHPMLREGIVRALTVKEARRIAGAVLLQELISRKDAYGSETRWTLANALTVASDETMRDTIEAMISDRHYDDVRERLETALKSLRKL
jgi:hypothetical protein